jgi:translocation and assembly module TamB
LIKRGFKILGLILLLLILLVVGGASWFAGTERGFQQSLSLAKTYAPGTLDWDEADGKWVGPLSIRGLHYSQVDAIEASVAELTFDWRPSQLLSAELAVDHLHIDSVEVRLAEGEDHEDQQESSSSGELPEIALPLALDLKDIVITDIAIYPPGQDTAIGIDRVALSANADSSDVHLSKLEITAPQGELHLQGNVATVDDYPMDLTVNWQADIGQSVPLQGEGTINGSLAQLQIDHQVRGFATAAITATLTDVAESPAWQASIEAGLPDAETVSALLTGTPQISLQSSGTLEQFGAQATVNLETTETGPVNVSADVSGSTETLDIHSLTAKLTDSGGELTVAGQISLASLHSDITGQWQALSWPVQAEPQFSSAQGSFMASGTPDEFTLNASTEVDGEAIPTGQWDISVNGSTTSLSRIVVQGQTLEGTVAAVGAAGWETQPEWDLELVTESLNPGEQWSEFPGSINLHVSSKGQIGDDGPNLNAEIKQLSGSLRQQSLSGSGFVQLQGETLNIENFILTHGTAQLNANGQIDDEIQLDFTLDSTDLNTLLPELVGAISVSGSVSGDKVEPMLNAKGNANGVAFSGNRVDTLNFDIDGGLAPDVTTTVTVNASDISAGGQNISDISISGQGTQREHSLVLSTETDQGELATQLDGGFRDTTWNGSLLSLQLINTPAGNWRLREPVTVTANTEKADASQLCLDNNEKLGSICVAGNWLAAGESEARLSIDGLSPELAKAYLPAGFFIETKLNAEASALLDAEGGLSAEAQVALDSGKLTLDSDASPVEIGLEETTINVSLRGDDASLQFASAIKEFGKLNATATVNDPAGEARLAGNLEADFPDLSLISTFVPQLQQVSGSLQGNLSLGGSVQTPQVQGELALLDFTAEIPETAMLIEATQLSVTGEADGTLLIDGESRSGDGQLDFTGSINPGTRALVLEITGDEYQVANTAAMQAVVSPQLNIELQDTGMQVNGEVTIPRVYINANGGNDGIETVSASSDVVYISEEGEQAEKQASQLNLDVQIILGDSVEVEAGDFRGRLEGDLRVQQTPELAPRGTGTINVLNGDYVIYGQQLNMERGRILFGGGPVDNPSLDMEVARTVQEYDVIAGARIQGTAKAPRLELYSEPSMPDASILSYILLGQPPGATGASYTIGKYLTPDLYVSYGIGLFDAINTFNMRYKLTEKLSVEAASGSGSSADLIYTIEK